MKLFRVAVLFLTVLFILGTGATALAVTENWTTDPANGSKICILLKDDSYKLVSANWSGPTMDGKADGQGMLSYIWTEKDGKAIKAQGNVEMKAGKLDGRVSIKWAEGDSYDGLYKEGVRDGRGVFRFADGRSYDGDWKAGNQCGKGVFRWPNGNIYEGDWKDGKMEGKGVYKWPDGQVYSGDWKNGGQEGKGVIKWPNGQSYDGDFLNGKMEGVGLFKFPDGTTYEGEVKNDRWEGKGVYRFPDGRTHEGEFKNNLPNGQGVIKDATGKVLSQGEFREGKLVNQVGEGARGKLTGFLGIAWGTAKEEAEKIILARPDSKWFGDKKFNKFIGSFADQASLLALDYKDGKFAGGTVWLPASEDNILPLFEKMKAQLTEKYGKADQETGKYLDSQAQWDFPVDGPGDCIAIKIAKTDFFVKEATLPAALRKPFAITVYYLKGEILIQWQQQKKQGSGSKDL